MHPLELVDELYDAFVDTLRGATAKAARGLAARLSLAPEGVPWSRVFGHAVTLAAPALVAEATPHVGEAARRDAVLAHMLAVIEAFGTDRIEDGQVRAAPDLEAVLAAARQARDRALARVCPGLVDPSIDYALADRRTRVAIATEHDLLHRGAAVPFDTYERVSLGKQAVGFPASLALAFAAGWEPRRRHALYRALVGVWLGLQMHDDVVDWEDDLRRGGAWAVSLALNGPATAAERETIGPAVRPRVHASGVLARMLDRSRRHFRQTRLRAAVLGACELSTWAGARETQLTHLLEAERHSAGWAVRAHALAAWAGEVLA